MPSDIEIHSRVGQDGVLDLHVPLGNAVAGAEVVVTIRRVPSHSDALPKDAKDWHDFVEETYGSCAGLGVERQPQGDFDRREKSER